MLLPRSWHKGSSATVPPSMELIADLNSVVEGRIKFGEFIRISRLMRILSHCYLLSCFCEKQSVKNTDSGKDLSEVAFLFVIAIAGVLQAGAYSRSLS